MKTRISSIALLAVALSWAAAAQIQPPPIRPGNWEIQMKMNIPGMQMEMPPMKQTQCVTAEMLKDPMAAVPKGPNGGDCKMSDYKLTANTATYTMTCTKPTPMTGVAEMTFTGTDAYSGSIIIESSGQKMSMTYDAKRIGECAGK